MRLLLKDGLTGKLAPFSGKWVDVDTSFLAENQYNITDPGGEGLRVMDASVARIESDARRGAGKCRWCGKIVHSPEGAERHFLESEAKKCALIDKDTACSYKREVTDGTSKEESEESPGHYVRVKTERYHYKCGYPENNPGRECVNMECRGHGIAWFTEENTFFLKYPDGFRQGCVDLNKIDMSEWDVSGWMKDRMVFKKRFGSYRFTMKLKLKSGTSVVDWDKGGVYEVDKLCLDNSNASVWFWYDRNDRTVITLDGIDCSPELNRRILHGKNSAAATDAEKKAISLLLRVLEPESITKNTEVDKNVESE